MPGKLNHIKWICLFILLTVFARAGETGKLAGRLYDAKSGDPLIGANILIEGTSLGATTDMDGEYFIINIPPGTYTVKFMYIGYQTVIKTGVLVSTDLTTKLNARLSEKIMELEDAIVVSASRSDIQKDLTSSERTFTSKIIRALPVKNINDIVSLQAGVVKDAAGDLHIRGGRTTEISYMVDGVQVIDPISRRSGISIDDQAIEELKTITGTFNAEYGQALSGVINIVTKRGSKKFKMNVIAYLGDYLSFDNDVYYVMDNTEWANAAARAMTYKDRKLDYDFKAGESTENKTYLTKQGYLNNYNPLNNQDFQMNISGPLPFTSKKVTYFASGRYRSSKGYQYGKRYFMPWGFQSPASDTVHTFESPDNEIVPLNDYKNIGFQGKLFYKISNSVDLSYGLYFQDYYNYSVDANRYKYIPDAGKNNYTTSQTHILSLKHVLSPRTLYEFKTSYYQKDYKSYLYENPYDYRYMPTKSSDFEAYVFGDSPQDDISIWNVSKDFSFYGNPTDHSISKIDYWTLILDLTSQVNKQHLLKMGASARLHNLNNEWYNLQFSDETYRPVIPEKNSPFYVEYGAKPKEFAAYFQDKIEYEDIILNIGLRFDYFDPGGKILSDPMDPQIYDPFKLDHIYKNYAPGVPDSELVEYSLDEREAFWYKDADISYQFSPRFGLSFPITEKGVIHFSYGHFFQNPEFRYLYENPNFWIEGAGARNLVGNANLRAQRTVMYEVGLQQELFNSLYLHLTAFYRDIRDWVGTGTPIDTYQGVTYYKYENKDHAAVKGVTLSANYRMPNFNISMDYTYMTAKGTSSDPRDAYYDALGDREPRLTLIELDWDQKHSFNTVFTYVKNSFSGSVVGVLNSGLPYTPTFARGEVSGSGTFVGLRENSERKPATFNVDLRFAKHFTFKNFSTELYINVRNLFDTKNARYVYSDTGRPDYTLDGVNQQKRLIEIANVNEYYTRPGYYTPPRFIHFGIRITR